MVGDGSVPPPRINASFTSIIRERQRKKAGRDIDPIQRNDVNQNYKLSIPNPLSTLVIVADKESATILFCSGVLVACLYAVNAGIPSQFSKIYGFDEIKIGLVFVPFGAGGVMYVYVDRFIRISYHPLNRKGFLENSSSSIHIITSIVSLKGTANLGFIVKLSIYYRKTDRSIVAALCQTCWLSRC